MRRGRRDAAESEFVRSGARESRLSVLSDMVELLGRRFESAVHRLHAGNHALERDLAVSILLELSEDGADARLSGLTSVEEAACELSDFLVVERAYRRVLQP